MNRADLKQRAKAQLGGSIFGSVWLYAVLVFFINALIQLVGGQIPLLGRVVGLLLTGQQLTMISLMGFIVLMGTVVNNGIVFVDYANQLRLGGMERRAALIATGKTRMRPILMTTLTTVLAMLQMVFSNDMASQLMSGMAIVIICGLSYATLMTLYIVPILYDILFKKPPLVVDVGDDGMDDIPDDAAEYIERRRGSAGSIILYGFKRELLHFAAAPFSVSQYVQKISRNFGR